MKKHIIAIMVIIYILKFLLFLFFAEFVEAGDMAVANGIFGLLILLLIDGVYMFRNKCANGWKISLTYIGMVLLEIIIVYILITQDLISDHIGFIGLGTHRFEYLFMELYNIVSCIILLILNVFLFLMS